MNRRHEQWAAALATVGAAAATMIPVAEVRLLVALPLVVVLPGYAIAAAVLGDRFRGGVERATTSVGLSLAAATLVGLGLHVTRLGLGAITFTAALATLTLILLGVASQRPYDGDDDPPARSATRGAAPSAGFKFAAGIALAAGAIVLARTPLSPPAGVEGYTGLGISRHPGRVAEVTVRSAELHRMTYVLRVEVDRMRVGTRRIALDPGAGWRTRITAAPDEAVRATLRRAGDDRVYRRARLAAITTPA